MGVAKHSGQEEVFLLQSKGVLLDTLLCFYTKFGSSLFKGLQGWGWSPENLLLELLGSGIASSELT